VRERELMKKIPGCVSLKDYVWVMEAVRKEGCVCERLETPLIGNYRPVQDFTEPSGFFIKHFENVTACIYIRQSGI